MTTAWMRRAAGGAAMITLAAIDLARPAGQTQSFTPAGSIPGPVDQVHVQGGFAYLAANQEFKIVDLSNQQAPKVVGTYAFPEKIWGFRVHRPLVYVAVDFFGLGILDISDPARPALRGSVKTPGQAKAVTVVGTTALLTDHVSGVDFVDIANTAKPASLGSFFLDGYARDVTSAGTTAYAVDSPTGLYVFDLSKPFDLSKDEPFEPVASQQSVTGSRVIDVVPTPGPSGVHLAVMTGGPELQVYDVANPKMPRKLASFPVPGGTQRADIRGSLAYVAAGPGGLQVIDLSTPAKPKIVAAYKTPSPARDVSVAEDGMVFVAMGKVATRYQGDGEVAILRKNP